MVKQHLDTKTERRFIVGPMIASLLWLFRAYQIWYLGRHWPKPCVGEKVNSKLQLERYSDQVGRWPTAGRHIMGQFDDQTVVVYQAYRPEIGRFAAEHGYFGGAFSLERMSWIKPNFLWMMFRSGWGTKHDQEVTLAIWLRRPAFDAILAEAIHSTFVPSVYSSEADWKQSLANSEVRLQWDPDHDPTGAKIERRALQLGLRGRVLERFAREWIVAIEDISDLVAACRQHTRPSAYEELLVPRETPYVVEDKRVRQHLGLDSAQ